MMWSPLECFDFGVAHGPTLEAKAARRRGRQTGEVARLDCAQIPLGRHVQRNGSGDVGSEPAGQIAGADAFVLEVVGEVGVEGHIVVRHQVSDVVQERRGHEVIGRAIRAGQGGRLQRVVEFGDVLVVDPQRRR